MKTVLFSLVVVGLLASINTAEAKSNHIDVYNSKSGNWMKVSERARTATPDTFWIVLP